MPARKARTQVFDAEAYGKAQGIITQGGPIISMLFGGGPMRRPGESVGYGGLGSKHAGEVAADSQSAAKSGIVHSGAYAPDGREAKGSAAVGRSSGTKGGPIGAFSAYSVTRDLMGTGGYTMGGLEKPRGLDDYYSQDTGMRRVTGEDAGPMLLLKEFQGSNRGSGGYMADVPRYSIAETRKTLHKFDKANFLRLNKHSGKKFLEPGTEQMMKKQKGYFGAARKVTRQFL